MTLPCGHAGVHKGRRRRSLLTVCGPVVLRHTYQRCVACGMAAFPVDQTLDLQRMLPDRARQLACLFGVEESFARAGRLLRESAGWSLAAESLRRLCHAEACWLHRDRSERLDTADHFVRAAGDWELQIDAGKVNTPDGWRDGRCATISRRQRAKPTDSGGYEQRDLAAPSVRGVVAEVEPTEEFGHRCQVESMRLKRPINEPLSQLGDGAE